MIPQSKIFLPEMIGKKLGMTQVFRPDGSCVAVTVIQATPNHVLGLRNEAEHGYVAVRVGVEPCSGKRMSKSEKGEFVKSGAPNFRTVRELRCDPVALGVEASGDQVKVETVFSAGMLVDISGTSIGKGFAGVVKRFHAKGQPMSRGTHEVRRHIGSIGCRKFPGRVFKNKKMPGRMGGEKVTVQNIEVVDVRADSHLLLVKGGIPGCKGSLVKIRIAVKGHTAAGVSDGN